MQTWKSSSLLTNINQLFSTCSDTLNKYLFYGVQLAFILGIIFADLLGVSGKYLLYILIAAVICCVIAIIFRTFKLLLLSALLLGILWCGIDLANLQNYNVPVGRTTVITGKVVEVIEQRDDYISKISDLELDDRYTFIVKGQSAHGWQGRVMVTSSTPVQQGDKVEVKALTLGRVEHSNLDVRNNEYFRNNSVAALLQVVPQGLKILELEQVNPVAKFAGKIKEGIYQDLTKLPSTQQGFIKGIAFGDKTALSAGQLQVLSQTGIMHVFAVSGLHIGFVVMFAGFIMSLLSKLLPIPKWLNLLIVSLFAVFYGLVAGLTPSVVRAVIMSLVAAFVLISGEDKYKLSIVLAAFGCLLWQPLWIYNIGFQLSFLATFGIIFTKDIWAKVVKFDFVQITLAAQFMVMPLVAYYFNILTVIGIILSPIAAFAACVVVVMVLLAMLLIGFGLGDLPLYGAGLISELMYKLAALSTELPGAWLRTIAPGILMLVLYFILLALSYYFWQGIPKQQPTQGKYTLTEE